MIDLTPFLTTTEQKQIGPLFMSDQAAEELGLIIAAHHAQQFCTPEYFAPSVVKSVSDFLNGRYFVSSDWFRRQCVHTAQVCSIQTSDCAVAPVFHVLRSLPRGFCVVSPNEWPLPNLYYDERVLEEVRVDTGIADSAGQPKHGRMR